MRNYFIRYEPEADINYLYLFMLYGLAPLNKKSGNYDTITYDTKKQLAEKVKTKYGKYAFSYSTLTRVLNNTEYNKYFTVDNNNIILNTCFSKYIKDSVEPFIIISDADANFLIQQEDNLLAKYYCYLKYYCYIASKNGTIQNFTAKQFLSSIGLSTDNHSNLSKISSYNTLLSNQGLIKIEKYIDEYGHERNIYTLP